MTAEEHIAEQYELMLDNIGKPYDGKSLMTPDLDAWWHGRKHKVRERIEGLEHDTKDRLVSEVYEKVRQDLLYDYRSDLKHDILDMLNDDFVSLAKDALRTAVNDTFKAEISEQVKAIMTKLAVVRKDDVADFTKKWFDEILGKWQEELRTWLQARYEEKFGNGRIDVLREEVEKQVRDHFEKVAEEFLRESLKLKVEYQPKRKLILS